MPDICRRQARRSARTAGYGRHSGRIRLWKRLLSDRRTLLSFRHRVLARVRCGVRRHGQFLVSKMYAQVRVTGGEVLEMGEALSGLLRFGVEGAGFDGVFPPPSRVTAVTGNQLRAFCGACDESHAARGVAGHVQRVQRPVAKNIDSTKRIIAALSHSPFAQRTESLQVSVGGGLREQV